MRAETAEKPYELTHSMYLNTIFYRKEINTTKRD